MDLGIAGKVALVTGGSQGIGLGCAQRLAAEGCKVVIAARTQANIDLAVAEIGHGCVGVSADCTTKDGIARAVQAFPDASAIYDTNIATLRAMGRAGWDTLMKEWT